MCYKGRIQKEKWGKAKAGVMTLKEYLERADGEAILHIGAGNSFFFVGPKGEFKPEDIDTFFKDEAKRRCENYVKYISRSLERVFGDGLEEKTKQSSHRRIKEHLQPILSNVTYLHDFTPVIDREVKEAYKRLQGDGIVVIVDGTEFGLYWDRKEYLEDREKRKRIRQPRRLL